MKLTVTILGLDSVYGRDLEKLLKKTLQQKLSQFELEIHPTIWNGVQYDWLKACMEDDLVFFDASIEEKEGSYDSNWEAACDNAMTMDHVLILSRTRLPNNYKAIRTNVAELGQEKRDDSKNPIYSYSNDEIIKWVDGQLDIMLRDDRIPVKSDLKMHIPSFEALGTIGQDMMEVMNRKMEEAMAYDQRIRKRGAFISYRSHYYDKEYHGMTVQDLKSQIKKSHNDDDYPVTVYAEKQLSFEFMTEQRRWGVIDFVDRKLRDVDEVYIFETGNEEGYGYYNSWWTSGEIISLMYIKSNGNLPRIFVCHYDEAQDKMVTEEKGPDFIPDLSKSSITELARYFANASGANENMDNMRLLRELDEDTQRQYFELQQQLFESLYAQQPMQEVLKANTFESFKASITSHVYDQSFTDNRIASCPHCGRSMRSLTIDDFGNDEYILDFIDVNSETDGGQKKEEIESRGFFSITPEEMTIIEKERIWHCPRCNSSIKVQPITEPQYQWWPIRRGMRTGPKDVIIERIVNWELVTD